MSMSSDATTELCSRCSSWVEAPGWCLSCGFIERIGGAQTLRWLIPDGDQLPWTPEDPDPLGWPGYGERRSHVRGMVEADEAVIARVGRIAGSDVRVVAVAYDFRFFGGSMGVDAGQAVAHAYDQARRQDLPIVLLPQSGGARMQEGLASLVQMAATSVAASRHSEAGLPQLTVLRDPTTGGVFASHASQGDVVLAERRAAVGFAGSRVSGVLGSPDQGESLSAEAALAAGLVDSVVDRDEIPHVVSSVLSWIADGGTAVAADMPEAGPRPARPPVDGWQAVKDARADGRLRLPQYLAELDVVMSLTGDRAGRDDAAVAVVLARLHGVPIVVVGLDRTHNNGQYCAAGLRKAWRGIALAEKFDLPIVTFVDTPGANASSDSERAGIAHHIAWTIRRLLDVRVPTVALLIGEGGSGGALALSVTDRVLMQERATFSVIAPEAATAILKRQAADVPAVARLLRATADSAWALGVVDEVVPEPPGATVQVALAAVARHLSEVLTDEPGRRLRRRHRRWRQAGRGHPSTIPSAPVTG